MVKNKQQKSKKTKKKHSKKSSYSIYNLVLGIIIVLLSVLGLFQMGFFGILIVNVIRLIIGESYSLVLSVNLMIGLWMMFSGRFIKVSWKEFIGSLFILVSIVASLHLKVFYPSEPLVSNVFRLTFDIFKNEMVLVQVHQSIGGGFLGACFYASFGYLFGLWGSYLISILLFLMGLMMIIGADLKAIQISLHKIGHSFYKLAQSLFPDFDKLFAMFEIKDDENEKYVPAMIQKQREEERESRWDSVKQSFGISSKNKKDKHGVKLNNNIYEYEDSETIFNESDNHIRRQKKDWSDVEPSSQILDLDYFDQMEDDSQSKLNNKKLKEEEKVDISTDNREVTIVTQENNNQIDEVKKAEENNGINLKDEEVKELNFNLDRSAKHWQDQANEATNLTVDHLTEDLKTEKVIKKDSIMKKNVNQPYRFPGKDLLAKMSPVDQSAEYERINENIEKLELTFESFGVDAKVVKANLGPSVTKYEVEPAIGVKVSKIVSLSDDIALALAARDIRMEAPIPGKSLIGIEVPNTQVSPVSFTEVVDASIKSKNILEVPLGRDISGSVCLADLAKMPHLLIAGATGSGKSVGMNVIICSLLMKAKPEEVKFLMIDPKKVELTLYDELPHLLTPVVTSPRKAAIALNKVVEEMERRYELFVALGVRNADAYNEIVDEYNKKEGTAYEKLPKIVVFIDELADLMLVASNEVENSIIRLAQMARAAGIHMIIATQRPSVDVITGIIKANIPSRLAFAVSSGTDSRTILDANGAEKLLGRGDMLFQPMGMNKPIRVQGAYISDQEVENITNFIKLQRNAEYDEAMEITDESIEMGDNSQDEYFEEVVEMIKELDTISISQLQRRFRIGYNRAARLVDDLEAAGYVSGQDGSKPRQVLISKE